MSTMKFGRSTARLGVERLETREVPAHLVADYGASGVWTRTEGSPNWVQISTVDAADVAVTGNGDVVGQFNGAGVWKYSKAQQAWANLTPSDAVDVDIAGSGGTQSVVGNFGAAGVYRWTQNLGWQQLTTAACEGVRADDSGNVVGDFGASGVYRWTAAAGWKQLTVSNPSQIDVGSDGAVLGDFDSAGLWRWTTFGNWFQLTASDPTTISIASVSNVTATFAGYGVWQFSTSSWTQLNAGDAQSVVAGGLAVYADFGAYGLYRHRSAFGWDHLGEADPQQIAAA